MRHLLLCAWVIAVTWVIAVAGALVAGPGAAWAGTNFSLGTPTVDSVSNGPWTASQPDVASGQS